MLDIKLYPDPILRSIAEPVSDIPKHASLVDSMLKTMYDANGIGLAAVQVGELLRLVVIDISVSDKYEEQHRKLTDLERSIKYPLILFNPEIVHSKGNTSFEEGCLSIPGYTGKVPRSEYVKISFQDRKGESLTLETDGLLAVCIQHEIDHLNGMLFLDRMDKEESKVIKAHIKEHGYS